MSQNNPLIIMDALGANPELKVIDPITKGFAVGYRRSSWWSHLETFTLAIPIEDNTHALNPFYTRISKKPTSLHDLPLILEEQNEETIFIKLNSLLEFSFFDGGVSNVSAIHLVCHASVLSNFSFCQAVLDYQRLYE